MTCVTCSSYFEAWKSLHEASCDIMQLQATWEKSTMGAFSGNWGIGSICYGLYARRQSCFNWWDPPDSSEGTSLQQFDQFYPSLALCNLPHDSLYDRLSLLKLLTKHF
uniref:Uncharacterized protein n=1 Tax=Micrurus paraensis TaxID=1970185 RepID=A0A2D4K8I3_9SAUR